MTDERYGEFLPPRAPGASSPPRFDRSQPPGMPIDASADEEEPGASAPAGAPSSDPGVQPLPPPPPGRADPPPPVHEDAWQVSPPAAPREERAQGPRGEPATGWPARPAPGEGSNGLAIASLVLGVAGLVVWALGPFGLAFVINLPASILAWVFGVKGKARVDRGELTRHRGAARAGLVLGVIGTAIGVAAIVVWALVLILDEGVRNDLIDQLERATRGNGTLRAPGR